MGEAAPALCGAARHGPLDCLQVSAVDWVIVVFTGLMAAWGYAQGLIVGALSLFGFAGGALLGSRLGPLLLEEGSQSPYAPLFALVGALMVGGILASGLELLGFRLRRRMGAGGADGRLWRGRARGLSGAWPRMDRRGGGAPHSRCAGIARADSAIHDLSELNERLPPSGPILQALARFDPFPKSTVPGRTSGLPTRRSRGILRCAQRAPAW